MSILSKKISQYGKAYKISEHFTLGEFQCRDGSDTVKYSTELLAMLEKLRSYGGFSIQINSGYRTVAYNQKIGGASRSQHIDGTAADIVVKKDGKIIAGKLICCLCQTLGFRGVAFISNQSTHVDMRASGTYRGDERSGYGNNVTNFYKYFSVTEKQIADLKRVSPTEESEEEMTVYKTINDVPTWYKEAIQKIMSKGYLTGTGNGEINVTDDFCRIMTVLDRAGIFDGSGNFSKQEVAAALVDIAQSYE